MVWVIDFRKDKKLLILIGKNQFGLPRKPEKFFHLAETAGPCIVIFEEMYNY